MSAVFDLEAALARLEYRDDNQRMEGIYSSHPSPTPERKWKRGMPVTLDDFVLAESGLGKPPSLSVEDALSHLGGTARQTKSGFDTELPESVDENCAAVATHLCESLLAYELPALRALLPRLFGTRDKQTEAAVGRLGMQWYFVNLPHWLERAGLAREAEAFRTSGVIEFGDDLAKLEPLVTRTEKRVETATKAIELPPLNRSAAIIAGRVGGRRAGAKLAWYLSNVWASGCPDDSASEPQ